MWFLDVSFKDPCGTLGDSWSVPCVRVRACARACVLPLEGMELMARMNGRSAREPAVVFWHFWTERETEGWTIGVLLGCFGGKIDGFRFLVYLVIELSTRAIYFP